MQRRWGMDTSIGGARLVMKNFSITAEGLF